MLPSILQLLILSVIFTTTRATTSSPLKDEYDIVIFGATPAGFAASIAAARSPLRPSILLLEPSAHVGGMASPGGIGLRDCEKDYIRTNKGSQYEWGLRNGMKYGVDQPIWQPDNHVGEATFLEMLSEYENIDLQLNTTFLEGKDGLRVSNKRIEQIAVADRWIRIKSFVVDASYEGEIVAASGCSFTYGRESLSQYNESFGGVTKSSTNPFPYSISPFKDDNATSLLSYISDSTIHVGQSDEHLMAFSYRVCLSSNNFVPFMPPTNYDPKDFELARRLVRSEIEAGEALSTPWGDLTYHGFEFLSNRSMKFDACCGNSPFGIDAAGLDFSRGVSYAIASRAERSRIAKEIEYYVKGLMWFWSQDESIPSSIRDDINSKGLCADEWPENGHFPPQLYVREAMRLVGDRVYTQNDRTEECRPDSIGIGSWAFDIHQMQRVAAPSSSGNDWIVFNEGLTAWDSGGDVTFDIPFWILLPKRDEITNMVAPNVPSVSHVAFAALREEPTLWQLGTASGIAAAMVMEGGSDIAVAVHDLNVTEIQHRIATQEGTFLRWPLDKTC